ALQVTRLLAAGASTEVVVFLGQGSSVDEARAVVQRYRAVDLEGVLDAVTTRWDDLLAAVLVKTPDRSFDLMLNRWLLYQALACRLWARAGFYQASGAYGFRDQLQDVMALTVAARDVTRAPRRADADLRRSGLARVRDGALHGGHRGYDRPRRADPVRRGARAGRREPRGVLRAHGVSRARVALRALRPRARPEPGRWKS